MEGLTEVSDRFELDLIIEGIMVLKLVQKNYIEKRTLSSGENATLEVGGR